MEVKLTLTMPFKAPATAAEDFIQALGDAINSVANKFMVERLPGGEIVSKPVWPGEECD